MDDIKTNLKRNHRSGPNTTATEIKLTYMQMASNIREDPLSIFEYIGFIQKICMQSKVELIIENNEFYLTYGDTRFTDFGIFVLSVKLIHQIHNQGQYEVELLILNQYESPKIIYVNSSELDSCRWLENLGVSYIYEKWAIQKIKVFIKSMAKFAPTDDEYRLSGWYRENIRPVQ